MGHFAPYCRDFFLQQIKMDFDQSIVMRTFRDDNLAIVSV